MRIIRSVDELQSIQPEWDDLAKGLSNPFLQHGWLLSCARTIDRQHQLQVVVLRDEQGLAGIAPLARVWSDGHRRLEFAGSSLLAEPTGFVYRDEPALKALIAAVIGLGRPLMLRGITSGGDVERVLRQVVASRHAVLLTGPRRPVVFLPIRTAFDDYMRSLSPKMRQDIRRFWARARQFGETRSEIRSPDPAEAERLFDTFVTIEQSGWKGGKPLALARHERLREFFHAVVVDAASRGELRVGLLHVAGRPVAIQLYLEASRRIWNLKMAFDETVAWCSPGFLLMHEIVRDAHERHIDAIEFLGFAEPWEQRFRPESRAYVSALVYPPSLRGLSALGLDAVSRAARRVRTSIGGLSPASAGRRRMQSARVSPGRDAAVGDRPEQRDLDGSGGPVNRPASADLE